MSSASLPRSTPTTPTRCRNANASSSARTSACGAADVVGGVDHHRRARTHQLEASRRGHAATAAWTISVSRRWLPLPRNASTAAMATARFCAWCCAVQRQEQVGVLPRHALHGHLLPAERHAAAHHAELRALAGDGGAALDRAAQQHLGRLGGLVGHHDVAALGEDAGLLLGDLAPPSRPASRCGRARSAAPPRPWRRRRWWRPRCRRGPTSSTATSTGVSANAANAMQVRTSK